MGTHFLPLSFSLSFTSPNPINPKVPINPVRRSSIFSRTPAIPRDDSNAETFRSGRSRFSFDDDLFTDDDQGTAAKQRIWWSDDVDHDDDDDEEEDDEFWIFKVLKAFGWMVPAIGISMLLGTGPNALLMAIALPLGQSIFSLAIDKAWPTKDSPRPRPRPKSRKKPFTKKASNIKAQEENNIPNEKGREANYRSVNIGKQSTSGYGGWDELENEKGTEEKSRTVINRKMDGFSKEQSKGKLTRRGRNRDAPLVVRLLVAVFPFLGSWTRLFL